MTVFVLMTGLFGALMILGQRSSLDEAGFMNRQFTEILKGISIQTVVWAHGGARLGIGGIQFIAGTGVALFLICSGFGLEESFQRNGIKNFWRKRLLRLCIPYWIVSIVGLFITNNYNSSKFLKAIAFIDAAWFTRYIFICYVIFWICKKVCIRVCGMFCHWFINDLDYTVRFD